MSRRSEGERNEREHVVGMRERRVGVRHWYGLSLQEHQRQRVQNVQVTRSGPQCSERSGTARSTVCKLDHFTTASHLIKLVYHCKSSNQTSTRIAGAKGPVGAVGPAGCYMKGW